jgi:hypothetical protein
MTYKLENLTEIIIYAQDESDIVSASYYDPYGLRQLTIIPYTQLRHPLVLSGIRFPDVNFDGKVNQADINCIQSAWMKTVNDPGYNEIYDLDYSRRIDSEDLSIVGCYYGTVTFATFLVPSYSIGQNVSFTFQILDGAGNVAEITGSFNVEDYEQLSGIWKINNITVEDSTIVELSERKTKITFICDDTTITPQDVIVKVTIGNTVNYLTYAGNNTWQGIVEFLPGINAVVLEASTQAITPKMNKISVIVKTPELFTFTIEHALMLSGGILLIVGIIVISKKEEEAW